MRTLVAIGYLAIISGIEFGTFPSCGIFIYLLFLSSEKKRKENEGHENSSQLSRQ